MRRVEDYPGTWWLADQFPIYTQLCVEWWFWPVSVLRHIEFEIDSGLPT